MHFMTWRVLFITADIFPPWPPDSFFVKRMFSSLLASSSLRPRNIYYFYNFFKQSDVAWLILIICPQLWKEEMWEVWKLVSFSSFYILPFQLFISSIKVQSLLSQVFSAGFQKPYRRFMHKRQDQSYCNSFGGIHYKTVH